VCVCNVCIEEPVGCAAVVCVRVCVCVCVVCIEGLFCCAPEVCVCVMCALRSQLDVNLRCVCMCVMCA